MGDAIGGMNMLGIWREVIMKAALERFSPVALRILGDERVQALLGQMLNLQADVRENLEAQVRLVARTLDLVTRDELTSLRAVVKELEKEVGRLKDELAAARAESKPTQETEVRPQEATAKVDDKESTARRRRSSTRKSTASRQKKGSTKSRSSTTTG